MYGAYITYRDHLALPDSAEIMAISLEQAYPDSPQAFQLREGEQGDLLAYLLDLNQRQIAAQAAAQAALQAEIQAEVQEEIQAEAPADTQAVAGDLPVGATVVGDTLSVQQLVEEGAPGNSTPQPVLADSLSASPTVPETDTENESSGDNPTGGDR
jgi:hypothetical protein